MYLERWQAGFRRIEFQRVAVCLSLAALALSLGGCNKLKEALNKAKPAAVPAAPLEGSVTRELGEADYDKFIGTPGRLSVVVFHATWCGPCKQLAPVIERVADDFSNVSQVGRFDVDKCPGLAGKLGVQGIPDVRFFVDGKQADAFVGGYPEPVVRQKFQTLTKNLAPAVPVETPKAPAAAAGPQGIPGGKDGLPPGMSRTGKDEKWPLPKANKAKPVEKPAT